MTDHQLPLFTKRLIEPLYQRDESIQQRFEKFHDNNTWVYAALVRLALKYQAMGRARVGIGHLVEILRWEYAKNTQGDEFKLNNNFRSRYVRLIQQTQPALVELFETRTLRAA